MEVQKPDEASQEISPGAQTDSAADPTINKEIETTEESSQSFSSAQFESHSQSEGFNENSEQLESQPQYEGYKENSEQCQGFESQTQPEVFSEQHRELESQHKHESFNKNSEQCQQFESQTQPEGSNENSEQRKQLESQPQPEGSNENSEQHRQFESQSQSKGSTEIFDKDHNSSALRERSEVESVPRRTPDEIFEEQLKALETGTPSRRSASKRKRSGEKQRRKKAFSKQKMGRCVGRFAADCAAVVCCPCVIGHVLILALVKAPIRAIRYVKRKARIGRKKKNDDADNASASTSTGKKHNSFRVPWSLTDTPHISGSLEESPGSKIEEKDQDDSQKFWLDLYASGRIGFGGAPQERD